MKSAAANYTAADFMGRVALVLGSEAAGLSPVWASAGASPAITPIALPMLGAADSLNLSAAAAVLFYEALRQREAAAR
jgi:TrmH family RNA methyltransferase